MTDGVPATGLRASHAYKHSHGPQHVHPKATKAAWPGHERVDPPRRRAHAIFAQEAHAALAKRFGAAKHSHQHRTAEVWQGHTQRSATPKDTADTLVGTAKQIVAQQPAEDSKATIAEISHQVRHAAASAHLVVRSDAEHTEIDATLAQFESRLETLQSSQAPAHAAAQLQQGSRIQIRTQEGDIVELRLRQDLGASTLTTSTDDGAATRQLTLSSSLGLRLEVVGHINDAELAAITDVFEQAAEIAEAFFGGDLAAAFDAATGLVFDSEQLATIALAFRYEALSATTYAALSEPVQSDTPVAEPDLAETEDADTDVGARTTDESVAPTPVSGDSEIDDVSVNATDEEVVPVADTNASPTSSVEPEESSADGDRIDSLADLTRIVADFFASLIANLGTLQASREEGGETSYRLATAFKLDVLQTVLRVSAPEGQEDAADAAAETLERAAYGTDEVVSA